MEESIIFVKNENVTKGTKGEETPLMKQYNELKAKYPDAILLFRVGDFYETFGEDAIKTSQILGIILTRRANGAATYIELAGFPWHSLDTYLPRLVKAGQRVAICEQLEDPKLTKKIVKRGITELVSPGLTFSESILDRKTNNFLASIYFGKKSNGIALLDATTGDFFVANGDKDYIERILFNLEPSELILERKHRRIFEEQYGSRFATFSYDDWVFAETYTRELLLRQFGTHNLKGFGIDDLEEAIIAAGACIHYLNETRSEQLEHICSISRIVQDDFVWLDRFTIRNLELINSYNENGKTLLEVIDKTFTPMGARLMRRWLVLPLKSKSAIEKRQNAVEWLIRQTELSDQLSSILSMMGDLERLIARVSIGKAGPRELLQLGKSLQLTDEVQKTLSQENSPLSIFADQLTSCNPLAEKIRLEIRDDCPAMLNKGNVISEGVSTELDGLRKLAYEGKDYLADIQKRESAATGISSLKIGFNSVFGYYLEVTHVHKDKVPSEWIRKQTLTGAERYITPELKQYEEKILGAEEKIQTLENHLFSEILIAASAYIQQIQANASALAQIDCLLSMALTAIANDYVKPQIEDSLRIDIKNGRHPVIEQQLPNGEKYIGNDLLLDSEGQQIIILTGPNMAGKSALLRQTALIVLLAQIGSYIPADAGIIGLVDKIFTRVGASDNLSHGESTFMVEMNETASILNNLSSRSLILLDEIGRGTSTYDGISIAWAITEFLHNHPLYRPRTLFATHYHELNELSTFLMRVKNYHIAVKEAGNKIIFLRKLTPGGTEHSFGIHVARMAGIPVGVIQKANEILIELENKHPGETGKQEKTTIRTSKENYQLSFIQLDDPLLEQIKEEILRTDIDTLTPVEALMKLNQIKGLLIKNKK